MAAANLAKNPAAMVQIDISQGNRHHREASVSADGGRLGEQNLANAATSRTSSWERYYKYRPGCGRERVHQGFLSVISAVAFTVFVANGAQGAGNLASKPTQLTL